jgi:23S rRNA (pseudouridine1915-N3)-methyltransferase
MPVPLFDINLIAVGKVRDELLAEKIDDFSSRLQFDIKFTIQEIKDSDKETEGNKIVEQIGNRTACSIAMSEEGKEFTSEEFAKFIQNTGRSINFCIGGHHGLSETVKNTVRSTISLSRMTFTHEMARLLLVEQIYRAVSIIKNRKYHR